MYDSPSPVHGFFRLGLAFVLYLSLGVGVAMGATAAGLSDSGVALAFLLALIVLLKPFSPVFRRFMPDRIEPEE
ncbi:MAG: hypothetical protein ACI91T_001175 [Natronomonas sp.]|jgi:hypothetical protein